MKRILGLLVVLPWGVIVGCGEKQSEKADCSSKQAFENPFARMAEPDEPVVEYEKYLPDTPSNKELALLLRGMQGKRLFRWAASLNLEEVFPDAVEPLLSLAENEDCPNRGLPIACLACGKWGSHTARVIGFLDKARKDKAADVRAAAISVTFDCKLPEATTDLLLSAFADDVVEVREEVLGIVARDENPVLERLSLIVAGLKDEEKAVRETAIDALDFAAPRVKPIVPELRTLLDARDEYIRGAVIEALAVCGPTKEDLDTIAAACESKEVPVQYRAAKALFHCDLSDPRVVDMALKVFDAVDCSDTRCEAAKVLAYVYPAQERIVLRLAKALHEPDLPGEVPTLGETIKIRAKHACLRSLRFLGPDAAAAVPLILSAPKRHDFVWSDTYVEALRTIVPRHPEVLGHYRKKLAHGEFGMSDGDYFRALGKDAGQFTDDVIKILASADSTATFSPGSAREALPWIPGIPAKRKLTIYLRELNDNSENTRAASCQAIAALGPQAAPAVPALINLINNSKGKADHDRVCAIEALGRIGPAARDAVPHLRKFFDDPKTYETEYNSAWQHAVVALAQVDDEYRDKVLGVLRDDLQSSEELRIGRAIYRIGQIGRRAAPLLDKFERITADPTHEFFVVAAETTIRGGDEHRGADIAITELQSTDSDCRTRGCQIAALLTVPDQKTRVLPHLRRLLRDHNESISRAAADAIQALTGEEPVTW